MVSDSLLSVRTQPAVYGNATCLIRLFLYWHFYTVYIFLCIIKRGSNFAYNCRCRSPLACRRRSSFAADFSRWNKNKSFILLKGKSYHWEWAHDTESLCGFRLRVNTDSDRRTSCFHEARAICPPRAAWSGHVAHRTNVYTWQIYSQAKIMTQV